MLHTRLQHKVRLSARIPRIKSTGENDLWVVRRP